MGADGERAGHGRGAVAAAVIGAAGAPVLSAGLALAGAWLGANVRWGALWGTLGFVGAFGVLALGLRGRYSLLAFLAAGLSLVSLPLVYEAVEEYTLRERGVRVGCLAVLARILDDVRRARRFGGLRPRRGVRAWWR
ncbi:hypothetical protein [Streptomyces sp. NPDC090022]|uniref:hypothetical protein n=1 Tax=Streptomyces sp. NPDC090022 TaxID=3365920 RepID=UPI0038208F45